MLWVSGILVNEWSAGAWLANTLGDWIMSAIVKMPHVIEEATDQFADLFANAPQRRHFAEYLTGLMVASNKTVSGIQSEFANTTDQSCLNRMALTFS